MIRDETREVKSDGEVYTVTTAPHPHPPPPVSKSSKLVTAQKHPTGKTEVKKKEEKKSYQNSTVSLITTKANYVHIKCVSDESLNFSQKDSLSINVCCVSGVLM